MSELDPGVQLNAPWKLVSEIRSMSWDFRTQLPPGGILAIDLMSNRELQPFSDELMGFLVDLAEEGERALVIGGVARIDVVLERLLKAVLRPHSGGDDNLFDPDRPLGSFSAKISLAWRMGLLDTETERSLQMIRKIRNDFAHAETRISLSDAAITSRVRELASCAKKAAPTGFDGLVKDLVGTVGSELKASFCMSLVVVGNIIERCTRENRLIEVSQAIMNYS